MTAREINAFDEMFSMIFSAVSEQKGQKASGSTPRTLSSTVGIGKAHSSDVSDLFGKLRRQSKHVKWTTEADEELDRKKEQIELCDTDQKLLAWAMREVFEESKHYEENARRAPDDANAVKGPVQLQPPTYPHLIALLIRTFREKFADPHLALSIFDHARHLSIASYVFGCTTPAYNELIETRWRCFRDLRGVCDALEEMRANGVGMDNKTRALSEAIRREVGERNLWQVESAAGGEEVWDMVAKIEKLTAQSPSRGSRFGGNIFGGSGRSKIKRWTPQQESWKGQALQTDGTKDAHWEFGKWGRQEEDRRMQA